MDKLKTLKDLTIDEEIISPIRAGILGKTRREIAKQRGYFKEKINVKDLKQEAIKWIKEINHPDFKLDIKCKDDKRGEGNLKEKYYPIFKKGMEMAFLTFFNITEEDLK